MEWYKFGSGKCPLCHSEEENFLVTDGKKVFSAWFDHKGWYLRGDNELWEEDMTHWTNLSHISLPNQPERLNDSTSKDEAIV